MSDTSATQAQLYNLLLTKEHDDDEVPALASPGAVGSTGSGVASPVAAPSYAASTEGGESGSSTSRAIEAAEKAADLEREKRAFLAEVCTDSTRTDVREAVSRCFLFAKRKEAEALARDALSERSGRRRRARSSAGNSDSGASVTTFATLAAAGGSIAASRAAASRRAPSVCSDLSLVVHQDKGLQLLSPEERLRAYLANQIPELTEHVNRHIALKVESVRNDLDTELVHEYLLGARRRGVFKDQANWLRWQSTRHLHGRRQLDDDMHRWILEAVTTWDQANDLQGKEAEVGEADLVYDYLTKRGSHIDTTKLATRIPVFQTLKASYCMPSMWRDATL